MVYSADRFPAPQSSESSRFGSASKSELGTARQPDARQFFRAARAPTRDRIPRLTSATALLRWRKLPPDTKPSMRTLGFAAKVPRQAPSTSCTRSTAGSVRYSNAAASNTQVLGRIGFFLIQQRKWLELRDRSSRARSHRNGF